MLLLVVPPACLVCGEGTEQKDGTCVGVGGDDTAADTGDPSDTAGGSGADTADETADDSNDDSAADSETADDTNDTGDPTDTGPDVPAGGRYAGTYDAADVGIALRGTFAWDVAGNTVKAGADLTGDGHPDVVVAAIGADAVQRESGLVYVVEGPITAAVDLDDVSRRVRGELEGQQLGLALAVLPDATGDGIADLLVGSATQVGTAGADAAWLLPGPLDGTVDVGDVPLAWRGEAWDDRAGWTLDSVGDADDDGLTDWVIGASYGNGDRGGLYVLYGATAEAGDVGEVGLEIPSVSNAEYLGMSVAGVGDVDGDGLDDLLTGGNYLPGNGNAGAWLFHGPLDAALPAAEIAPEDPYVAFGRTQGSLAGAGDLDGDGRRDLVVGDPYADEHAEDTGSVWVFSGDVSGATTTAAALARVDGEVTNDALGAAVCGPGDLDQDGQDDAWLGARWANGNGAQSGAAVVFYGPLTGVHVLSDAAARFDGDSPEDQLGLGCSAGDLDGDGYAELLAAAPTAAGEADYAGVAWVFPGLPAE